MPRLLDLPSEIIEKCAEELHGSGGGYLLNLARTCRALCQIVVPVLRRTFRYDGPNDEVGGRLFNFFQAVWDQPTLAECIRNLSLQQWYLVSEHEAWLWFGEWSRGRVYDQNMLGSFFCSAFTQLRDLDIEYPPDGTFLNFHSDTIERLSVRPAFENYDGQPIDEGARRFPMEGMLKLDFLPYVLRWPKLTELSLQGTSVFHEVVLLEMDTSSLLYSSSITDLCLRLGRFHDDAIDILLRMPKDLKSLRYQPPTREDTPSIRDVGSYPDDLPPTSFIFMAIESRRSSLETLVISRPGASWDAPMDCLESLHDFPKLKHLEIDAAMLLGYDHCHHIRALFRKFVNDNVKYEPREFGCKLPPNLQSLTVVLEQPSDGGPQDSCIEPIIEGIAALIRQRRLVSLKRIHVKLSKCDYCFECPPSPTSSKTALDQTVMPLNEEDFRRLQRTLKEVGCIFTVAWHLGDT